MQYFWFCDSFFSHQLQSVSSSGAATDDPSLPFSNFYNNLSNEWASLFFIQAIIYQRMHQPELSRIPYGNKVTRQKIALSVIFFYD